MAVIEISNIKKYVAKSGDTLPLTAPAGSIAYVDTTGTPNVIRTWVFDGDEWGRLAVSEAVA